MKLTTLLWRDAYGNTYHENLYDDDSDLLEVGHIEDGNELIGKSVINTYQYTEV